MAARFSSSAGSTGIVELGVFILKFDSELWIVVDVDEGAKSKANPERSKQDGEFMLLS